MVNLVSGLQINYYFICKTKLWLYSHNIELEKESDNVALGTLLHENSYKRSKKEVIIDNKISIDFIKNNNNMIEIHEIKKSNKMLKSDKYQVLYYLYYLKREKDIHNVKAIINYPLLKKTKTYELDDNYIKDIELLIDDINKIINEPRIKPRKRRICNKCAYFQFCFS